MIWSGIQENFDFGTPGLKYWAIEQSLAGFSMKLGVFYVENEQNLIK